MHHTALIAMESVALAYAAVWAIAGSALVAIWIFYWLKDDE
jgi:hypothetical protein